ncbi:MAG: hypothetical protein CMF50_01560, partial [Legionellales bacterium]|nr:hypothetical protein [Legionellales bacterium]
MVKLVLSDPQGNQRSVELQVVQRVKVKAGDMAVFNDSADNPSALYKVGEDLILLFEDGRSVILEGFFIKSSSSSTPTPAIEIQDQVYRPPDFDTSPQLFIAPENVLGEEGRLFDNLTISEIVEDNDRELLVFAGDSNSDNNIVSIMSIATPPTRPLPPITEEDTAFANDDFIVQSEDNTSLFNVLTNDHSPNGPLDITNTNTTGLNGNLNPLPDGNFTYTPHPSANGLAVGETLIESFTYIAEDPRGDIVGATVHITIEGRNDAPISNDDMIMTDEDTPIVISPLINDSDPDTSDTIQIINIDDTGTVGTVTDNTDGTITYDPTGVLDYLDVGDTFIESVTYVIEDPHGATSTSTVYITVTGVEDPLIANDDTATTDEDTPVSISVLGNDQDLDDGFSITAVTPPPTGSVSINGNNIDYDPTGVFDFLDVGDTAIETFTYEITNDDGTTNVATVTVTVIGVEDPLIANDDTATTDEDTLVSISVLDNDIDPDDAFSITGTTNPTLGTVSVNGNNIDYNPAGALDALDVGDTSIQSFTYEITNDD